MREPATSCTECGRVLLPVEVLYTPAAALVCEACLEPSGPLRRNLRVRTRAERHRSLRRWSWLFAGLMLTAGYVGQISRAQLRAARAMATIDFPGAHAPIPRHAVVRGHVAADAITRPLWLVASAAARPCVATPRTPVVADRTGTFTAVLDLDEMGPGEVRLAIVSVDENAGEAFESPPAVLPAGFSTARAGGPCPGELPRGAQVLTSVDVRVATARGPGAAAVVPY